MECDLLKIISMIENPFDIYPTTFSDNTFNNATLYVPVGTVEKYKKKEGWKGFANIKENNVDKYNLTYMIDDVVYKTVEYEYGATITPEPQPEGDYATFEWTDLPVTMPAHDVTVYASYTSGIEKIVMSQNKYRIYGPHGKPRSKLQNGLNIVIRVSDGVTKKIVVK